MSVRSMLKWLNDALRPAHVGEMPEKRHRSDKEDILIGSESGAGAPIGWVPSQDDEKPK